MENLGVISVTEAASVYGRDPSSIHQAISEGRIQAIKLRGPKRRQLHVSIEEFEAYVAKSEVRSTYMREAYRPKGEDVTVAPPVAETVAPPAPAKNIEPWSTTTPIKGMVWAQDRDQNDWVLVKAEEYEAGKPCQVHGRLVCSDRGTSHKVILYPSITTGDYKVIFLPYEIAWHVGLPTMLMAVLLKDILTHNECTVDERSGRLLLD